MIINILTRTHEREEQFNICKQSILSQTAVESINWIVGSDSDCPYYPEAIKLYKDIRVPVMIPQNMYFAPWNTYLDTLQSYVQDGWLTYIDDDDCYVDEKSVKRIINAIDNDDQLLIWKVQITPNWTVPSHSFGKYVCAGDFSGIGFAFHSKYLPVLWGNLSYGDYRVAYQLIQKGLQIKWLDMILTRTQAGPRNGR